MATYLPAGGPGITPIRTPPVLVWRASADGPGYFGGDRVYTHVWLTVLDDLLLVESDRYTYEPYGGWWEGPYGSHVTVHDGTTGLRLWGLPGEPVAVAGGTVTFADGRVVTLRTGAPAGEVAERHGPGPSAGRPPPVRLTRAGDVVYTVAPDNVLVARDTVAERTLWQLPFYTRIAALTPAPGRLYVLTEGGHLTLLGALAVDTSESSTKS